MQYNNNPEITSLLKHFKIYITQDWWEMCRGVGLEKSIFGKCMRGRIVTSVMENVSDICHDRQHYLLDTA